MPPEPTLVFVDSHIASIGEISWMQGPLQPVTGPVCLVFEPRERETYMLTGIASGYIRVWSQALASRPPEISDAWQDVAEVSLKVQTGPLRVAGIGGMIGPDARLDAHGPGDYRLRIHANGRDTDYDGSRLDPVEDYLILAWPEPTSPPAALRTTSRVGQVELRSLG